MKKIKKTTGAPNILKQESGFIMLDFIFALTVSFGFAIIFFALSFTLSMVEMSQYITFATARAYSAANVSPDAQQDIGRRKFAELRAAPMVKTILNTGWITLGEAEFGDFAGDYNSAGDNSVFVGARIPFRANVLNMRIPVLGNTVNDSGTGFAMLNAYLLREVTTQECLNGFTSQRYGKLLQLNSRYSGLPTDSAAVITDNGC